MRKIKRNNKDREYRQETKNVFVLRNKKAVTEMVAYVLLVMIALILSIMVYAFLKLYVLKPSAECKEGISIAIDDYICNAESKEINITFKNTGRWDIDGFVIRASNMTEGKAVYPLISPGISLGEKVYLNNKLGIGQKLNLIFQYSELGNITKITIQPFMSNKTLVLCQDAIITQEIENCNEFALLPGTCTDNKKNQDESDVDCGGTNCGGCALGEDCMRNMDCLSGYCSLGTCQTAPPVPSIPPSLVSWWKFEGNGIDELGRNNLSMALITSYVPGKVGKAMNVLDKDKFAQNSTTPWNNLQFTGDFTIEALVYLNAIPAFTYAFIITELSGANPNYGLKIETSGKIGSYYNNVKVIESSDALQTGTWYHIAIVNSRNNLTLYINGKEKGSATLTSIPVYLGNDRLFVGRIINGLTDEVAVYNTALYGTDIKKHSDNALAGKNYFSE